MRHDAKRSNAEGNVGFLFHDGVFLDLDLENAHNQKHSTLKKTQQGHLHHWFVATRRRRPGAQDHVQEPYQVRVQLGCGKEKQEINFESHVEKKKLTLDLEKKLFLNSKSNPLQRHLLRGRRHLWRHRRHYPPNENRIRRQKSRRYLARLGLHIRLRSSSGGPDDGVG